jgi:hypothetical protein
VAFTYDGSGLAAGVKIYVDGTNDPAPVVFDDTLGTNTIQNNVSFNIGSRDDGAAHNFTGELYDVQVYKNVLSSNDVATIYASPGTVAGAFATQHSLVISSVTHTSGGQIQFQWTASPAAAFQVQWATSLASPMVWNTTTNGITASGGGVFSFTDSSATNALRFYRLVQMP